MVSVFAVTAFAADCKVNDSDISAEYVGGCVNGLAHGRGKAKGSDTYEGEFKQGNKHGKGIYLWASGNKYVGGWQNDKQAGLGVAEFTNGSRYEGEFKNGEANGFGAFTIPRKAIDIAKHTNKGQWIGENYIEKGLFKDTNFILGCNNNTDWS